MNMKERKQHRKGGTVVPPSNFQFVTTEIVMAKQVTNIFLTHTGAHAHASAHASEKVLNPLIYSSVCNTVYNIKLLLI